MNHFTRILLLVAALSGAGQAAAQVEVFDARDAWIAAVGSFHEHSFDGAALDGASLVEIGPGHGWGVTGGRYDDRVVGDSSFTVIAFETATTAFGAWWDLSPGGAGQGLQLVVDGRPMLQIDAAAPAGFFGFTSDIAFDSVWIMAGTQAGLAESYRMDSMVHAAPVPEPQTYLLMLVGLIAIGALVSRRMK